MKFSVVLLVIALFCIIAKTDIIYPGSFSFVEWNDANRVGDWEFEENWLQLEEPCLVCFVSVAGDNTITLNEDRTINEIVVGPNRWDTTRLVLKGDLTISYDDVPQISTVRGFMLPNGQIRLILQGKGFGFDDSMIDVTAKEVWLSDYEGTKLVDPDLENVVSKTYDCVNEKLSYRDAKVECTISPVDLKPDAFSIQLTVNTNGLTAEYTMLHHLIQ
eukprot:TRINITY_DN1760_c0_g1_i1.p1 TRINITY_DN1760_c0_g1~~TRINITY_DN1760_c0_g1_i1.p1  ORF type:complete len:217 (-),score=78.72 TRINITY_DN1760_c0_g1_i1:160-810(-)